MAFTLVYAGGSDHDSHDNDLLASKNLKKSLERETVNGLFVASFVPLFCIRRRWLPYRLDAIEIGY
jgi:hypothetical protein